MRGDSNSTWAAPWWLYLKLSCSVVATPAPRTKLNLSCCVVTLIQLELLLGGCTSTWAALWWLYVNLSWLYLNLSCSMVALPQLELLRGCYTSISAAPWWFYPNWSCSMVAVHQLELLRRCVVWLYLNFKIEVVCLNWNYVDFGMSCSWIWEGGHAKRYPFILSSLSPTSATYRPNWNGTVRTSSSIAERWVRTNSKNA